MGLEVRIDREKCQAHGKCVQLAPQTFSLGEDGKVVLGDSAASADDVLLRAARSCPYRVINLFDSGGAQLFPPVRKSGA